jgi:hypothetical protein
LAEIVTPVFDPGFKVHLKPDEQIKTSLRELDKQVHITKMLTGF